MKILRRPTLLTFLIVCGLPLVALLVAGCTSIDTERTAEAVPAPTVSNAFSPGQRVTPMPVPTMRVEPPSLPAPAARPADSSLVEVSVYDDSLSGNWSLEQSAAMSYTLSSSVVVDTGRYALAATPSEDFATLFFTVQPSSQRIFPRDQVLGLSFRLNSGDDYLDPGGLAVTVVGSNQQPYWVPNDTSVDVGGRTTEDLPLFSETRLYFLGINRPIPPRTWVDVVLWLDEREFDPDYDYVTGFYIKTDENFRRALYFDNVRLITQPQR